MILAVQTDLFMRSLAALAWLFLPVAAGYLVWGLALCRRAEGERVAASLSQRVSRLVIFLFYPPMIILVLWVARLPAGPALQLPLVGLFANFLGAAAAITAGRLARVARPVKAAWFLSGSVGNTLALGGVVAVVLLGAGEIKTEEQVLAILVIYRVFESPLFYIVIWPLAAMMAGAHAGDGWWSAFRRAFKPVTLLPIGAIAVGLALNFLGVERPRMFDGVAVILVKTFTVAAGFAVGLSLRLATPRRYAADCATIGAIKLLLVPLATVILAWALGFRGLHLQVVAICASMPVAFMSVVGANLLGLDEKRVASIWLATTAATAVTVPALSLVLPLAERL
jgi:predicted permease